ncbi:hypothetical protein SAMN05880501_106246 [Ureibacillus xyleni]|uniref:Uncharacterized protein n=1 Tax=Ureibacillus xyleni TaxID=614648 RepID=A0A285STT8_9BACL|nr:hypothetical protein [Ureibacillus xyleni]SOC11680.1 hypothetical protein SAMN05880501_106246 [Ureibacillus xyleni]
MERNVREDLDALIPKYISLSEKEKKSIISEANHRLVGKRKKRIFVQPVLVTVAMLFLIVLIVPSFLSSSSPFTPEKVTIPDHEYDGLINALYVDSTNELIFTDHQDIYSFNTELNEKSVLMDSNDTVIYDFAASEKWLIWHDIASFELNILNRQTEEVSKVKGISAHDLLIKDDTLIYMPLKGGEAEHSYKKLDLNTLEETTLHVLTGVGSSSKSALNNEFVVIPEAFRNDTGEYYTNFFLFDVATGELIDKFSAPFEHARGVTITGNRIYAQFSNGDEASILGYFNIVDGEFAQLDVPLFGDYAIYENTVALSLPKGSSNTVKLFELQEDGVKPLSTLNAIKERLVVPRFTREGTLIINGESADFSMYLIQTKE